PAARAFINCDKRLRPAAVIPPRLRRVVRPALPPPRCRAQRARAAVESLARVAADILRLPRRPVLAVVRAAEPPIRLLKRRSKLSIWRRIETASSRFLRDK